MAHPRKSNPHLEQRLREQERITSSASLTEKYPELKSLSLVLGYFDQQRMTHAGELRYKANVKHAKSVLTFHCPNSSCRGGGFDLSEVLLTAVKGQRRSVQGTLRCNGVRSLPAKEPSTCQNLLHYKLSLGFGK